MVETDLSSAEAFIERFPAQGDLGLAAWRRLAAAVELCGLETDCYVWMEPYRLQPPQAGCWLSDIKQVNTAVNVPANYYQQGPHAVWATDLSWFVVSDVDLSYSIISGPERLAERLVSDTSLEAFLVRGDQSLS
jgi:hypothetical protein